MKLQGEQEMETMSSIQACSRSPLTLAPYLTVPEVVLFQCLSLGFFPYLEIRIDIFEFILYVGYCVSHFP